MHLVFGSFLAFLLFLSACTDPEVAAQQSLDEAKADWQAAHKTLKPKDRVSNYTAVIADLESIAEDYPETRPGGALAAGRDAGGLSIPALKSELERLSQRAPCFTSPTSTCLLEFASINVRSSAGRSSADPSQQAALLVCEKDFPTAQKALEPLKINPPAYAESLVQLALQAAQCNKPDQVKLAVAAYLSAEPAQGAARINKLMSLLQTDALQPVWEDVLVIIEKELPTAGLAANQVAGTDLSLAVKYAQVGNADMALAKFNPVAQNFNVDVGLRIELASALLANGHPEAAMNIASQYAGQSLATSVIHFASRELGERLDLMRSGSSTAADVPLDGDLTKLFAPVDPVTKTTSSAVASQIESELDKFVATLQPKGEHLGQTGADATYGLLGLIAQKLGNPENANALEAKGEAVRATLSRPGTYNPESQNYLAEYQMLVALAQGRTDDAIALYGRVKSVGSHLRTAVFVELAKQGAAETALTFAARINSAGGNTYDLIITQLATHGHIQKAEEVLKVAPFRDNVKSALSWRLVELAAANDDLSSAQALAESYNLLASPGYQLRMEELKAESAIAKGRRSDAQTAILEMFTIGEGMDKTGQSNTDNLYAQSAATAAFKAAYTDLGIELYLAATKKDQRPLFAAIKTAEPGEFTELLMVANDNLRGENLGYVIDFAIRQLDQEGN